MRHHVRPFMEARQKLDSTNTKMPAPSAGPHRGPTFMATRGCTTGRCLGPSGWQRAQALLSWQPASPAGARNTSKINLPAALRLVSHAGFAAALDGRAAPGGLVTRVRRMSADCRVAKPLRLGAGCEKNVATAGCCCARWCKGVRNECAWACGDLWTEVWGRDRLGLGLTCPWH